MAIVISPDPYNTSSIDLDSFISLLKETIDFSSYEGFAKAAPLLQSLARNKLFFVDQIRKTINTYLDADNCSLNPYSANSLIVFRDENIIVRINFWIPLTEISDDMSLFFAYEDPHDHNFDFMTVGCFGPGYETLIYEYDKNSAVGTPGEKVSINCLGREILSEGKVILFRKSKDIHTQIPPNEFSVSLNLLLKTPIESNVHQFRFNLEESKIIDYMNPCAAETIVKLARTLKYPSHKPHLEEIANGHTCLRTRNSALPWAGEKLATATPIHVDKL